jgi:PHD/YefM family antitoxin component YafN of YafNO toxin-antitoxin module
MTFQHFPLTEANRRMKQIREFTHREGLVVLTSHDKPALVVVDVDRCLRLLAGMEQLMQLLLAKNLVEAARAINAAEALGLSNDQQWTQRALNDLQQSEDSGTKIRTFERSPRE